MRIKIDNREQELTKHIRSFIDTLPIFSHIQIEVVPLPIGDIILSMNGEENWIIERKSVADLAASIKDGRYEEQSYRLNGSNVPNHNIVYLIEGDISRMESNRFKPKVDKLTLYSAIFSLSYFKGFSVLRTLNVEETALFICNCANKMKKEQDKKPYYPLLTKGSAEQKARDVTSVPQPQESDSSLVNVEKVDSYVHVIKKVKKENITPENIAEIMLCQIPGISSVTALAVIKQFGSIGQLIEKGKTQQQELFNVTYETEKGQTRKISKTTAQNILDYLVHI